MLDITDQIENPLNLITPKFRDWHGINGQTPYKIYLIDAKKLLNPVERFDIINRYIYIEFKMEHPDSEFGRELYKKSVEAYSQGAFIEPDGSKDCYEHFLENFEHLIEDVKENGFDCNASLVPVNENFIIADGAHRVSTAAYYEKKIGVIQFNDLYSNYDYKRCREFYLLNEYYLDFMAYKWISIDPNIRTIIIWPQANYDKKSNSNTIDTIIENACEVIYKKRIELTENGLKNFVVQCYQGETWLGSLENAWQGANHKTMEVYQQGQPCVLYLVKERTNGMLDSAKQQIRKFCNVDKCSCHSTDTHQEALTISQLLLNSNSVHLLNNGNPGRYSKFMNKINTFQKICLQGEINPENIIIDASGVLGLYGLREPSDIDYLWKGTDTALFNSIADNHEEYIAFYGIAKDEILYNPKNYLWYNGLKFISLPLLEVFKRNRNEDKDKVDILQIKSITSDKKKAEKNYLFRLKLLQIKRNIKREGARILNKTLIHANKYKIYKFLIHKYHQIVQRKKQ